MPEHPALIAAWARSAVAPHGGAFRSLQPHQIAVPVIAALLQRAGLQAQAVDALVVGNALGAGGNPARMLALASGLPQRCASYSVDTQCCSGLDAVTLAVGLLASGQAQVVIAGGVEAWSRAPIRQHRPLQAGEPAVAYERPAFAPDPTQDPDLLESAAHYAALQGITRLEQDAYAVQSHERAVAHQHELAEEIVEVLGISHDPYPRPLSQEKAARMPVAAHSHMAHPTQDCAVSSLAISARADGAAFVLLATRQACQALGLQPRAVWLASSSVGADPAMPLLAAEQAARAVLQRAGLASATDIAAIELHDAFAVQGLDFCKALGLDTARINRRGGGIARGHPIGASGAMALVRLLADLQRDETAGAKGMTAIAGAGGIGAAAIVRRL
ncbi:acetyl-CoA C-acyltransferase [Rhodoferax lacus]|uniref:Acetyl-CoA C-acyltransferase n=1 Tax=Rhodoferax lacus TaxID=2184758 RepID=A0A3E1RHY9_9BURK|nr:thiolase family protein [Rhodoferax lacus]RFO99016.1 acetyl-CoA C-acyltransferase [Rhodoferax lacus]